MSSTGAGYDYSVSTYSPNGRVFQVEYAEKAVEKGGTVVAVRCKDGCVMGVEKTIFSKLLRKGSNRMLHTLDKGSGMAISGMAADARQLVNKAREEAQQYRTFWAHTIPGRVLADRIAGHVHMHTLYWYLRPFGCSVIIASYGEDGPGLYKITPSGVVYKYFGCAEGKHQLGAKGELEKINFETITCREAVNKIAEIIYKLHDDIKDKDFELELSWVCDESGKKHVRVPEELRAEAVKLGLAAKERAAMDSESDSDEEKAD